MSAQIGTADDSSGNNQQFKNIRAALSKCFVLTGLAKIKGRWIWNKSRNSRIHRRSTRKWNKNNYFCSSHGCS